MLKRGFKFQRYSKSNSLVCFMNSVFQIYIDNRFDLIFSFLHFIWAIYVVMRSCYFCPKANKTHVIFSIILTLFTSEFLIVLFHYNYKKSNDKLLLSSIIILKAALLSLCFYILNLSEEIYEFVHKNFSSILAFIHGILQFRIFLIVSQKANEIIGISFALSDTIAELLTRKLVRGRSESPLTGKKSIIRTSLIIFTFIIMHHIFKNKYFIQMAIISSVSLGLINFIYTFI